MKEKKADYLFMVEQATKAPSGHNTQPWLFRICEDSIEIHPDNRKTLYVVDRTRREMFVSLGCATENLCIAAESIGYASEVHVSEEGIISIELHSVDNQKKPLLSGQIARRQTNRSIYNGKQIPEEVIRELLTLEKEEYIGIYCWQKQSIEFNKIRDYVLAGNKIQMSDSRFKNELKSWMRFNKRDEQQTLDGLSYAVFGAPNLPRWLSRLIMGACLTPGMQNKSDEKKVNSSSHVVLFTVENDSIPEWIQLGRTLEHFLLKTTEAGIATAFINQSCELKVLAEQMQCEVIHQTGKEKRIPVVLLRMGYAKAMPYSPRKERNEVIISE